MGKRRETSIYDHVVLACHSDTALSIMKAGGKPDGTGGITSEENRILSLFKWIKNECIVHTDTQVRLSLNLCSRVPLIFFPAYASKSASLGMLELHVEAWFCRQGSRRFGVDIDVSTS
jgi:hypothetical protein